MSKTIASIRSGNDLTVVLNDDDPEVGAEVFNISATSPHYDKWLKAVEEDNVDFFLATNDHVISTLKEALEQHAGFRYDLDIDVLYYNDVAVPSSIAKRIVACAQNNYINYSWLQKFYERLDKNPSYRSRNMLFSFLDALDIPITPDGTILAYKAVRSDYTDRYSGTIDNSPGEVVTMPRKDISDDPNDACSQGLHAGALAYSGPHGSYSTNDSITVIVEIDPEDVVCVPNDHSFSKMRVCKYTVLKEYEGVMGSIYRS